MTTKFISSYYASGYELQLNTDFLVITPTGGVGGTGIYAPFTTKIDNYGLVHGHYSPGIVFGPGSAGYLRNGSASYSGGGLIEGSYGVIFDGTGHLINYGTIIGVVVLRGGGNVTNGAVTDPRSLIQGVTQGVEMVQAGTLANFAVVDGVGVANGDNGVDLASGGRVINGAATDSAATIAGYTGVFLGGAGEVYNFGAIDGLGSSQQYGVNLLGVGRVINGGVTDTAASIRGANGVAIQGAAATLTNFGAIVGVGAGAADFGVRLGAGGSLTNGAATHTGALIEGYSGVLVLGGLGTLVNHGTIEGDGVAAGEVGLFLAVGGSVTNGGGGGRSALIEGASGVDLIGAGTVANSGTIVGTTRYGVQMYAGSLTNGSLNNAAALIEGHNGLVLAGPVTASNFATVIGTGDFGGAGVMMAGGVSLTNGAVGHARALIEGFTGVSVSAGGATVTNFGTISGAGGTAVAFGKPSDVLVVEAGCAFVGAVLGGGGTLDLDSGTGTVTGNLAGASVTVSGSMAPTTFSNFGTVKIGSGGTFSTAGAVTIASGQSVIDLGSLTFAGVKNTVANAGLIETSGSSALLTFGGAFANTGTLAESGGTLTVMGMVTGTGAATIKGGTLDFASSFTQNVTFTGSSGMLGLAKSQTYTGTITGFSTTGGTSLDLGDIGFVSSTEATFSGTATSGVLTVTDGTHTAHITLMGNYTTSTFVASSDGHGGVKVVDPQASSAAGTAHRFIAALAAFGASVAGANRNIGEVHPAALSTMLAVPRLTQIA